MSGHRKNQPSTSDETALLRGQSHSRESSGASNLSVKFTADTAAAVVMENNATDGLTTVNGAAARVSVVNEKDGSHGVPAVAIVPSSPRGEDKTAAAGKKGRAAAAAAASARKKRLRPDKHRKSGKNSDGSEGSGSDPDEIVPASDSRLQNGSCDSIDTPPYNNNTDGMLQSGETKSHNSDCGSFCNTPSDNYSSNRHHESSTGAAPIVTSSQQQQPPVSAIGGGVGAAAAAAAGFTTTSSKPKAGPDQVDHQSAMATDQRQPLLDNSPTDGSCSDDDAGVSSGYTRRKTRLHQRPSNENRIPGPHNPDHRRIEIDPDPEEDEEVGSDSNPVHIPGEPCKTLLAFIFLFFAWVATTTSLALTHDRVPMTDEEGDRVKPLPDIILDNVTYQHWGLDASEYIIMISFWIAFLTCIFHKHRCVVLRRVFILVGLHYYYRAVTMFVTVLPVADPNYKCAPQKNATDITAGVIAQRVLKLLSGFGLSINGEHIYCGDYIYSGHSMTLIMVYLVVKAYSPKRWFLLHYATFCLSFAGILFLVLARGHYSIDVVVAYWITTRLWYIYHTMTNNGGVLKDTRNSKNYFRKMWWWYMFYYFEGNVPVTVPREYNLPVPNRVLRLKPFAWLLSLCGGAEGIPSRPKRDEDDPAAGGDRNLDRNNVETVSSEVARQEGSDVEAGRRRRDT